MSSKCEEESLSDSASSAKAAPLGARRPPKTLVEELRRLRRSRNPHDRDTVDDIRRKTEMLLTRQSRNVGRKLAALLVKAVDGVLYGTDLDDVKTLEAARRAYLQYVPRPALSPPPLAAGRAESRIRDCKPFLHELKLRQGARHDVAYLDVGCSEGKITAAVAGYLQLPAAAAIGVDVVSQTPDPAFTFQLADGRRLDFPDASFDLITMFMSAHHFRDAAGMLAEAHRVARPGATLIMREHDARTAGLALWFDLVHALYAVVVNGEETAGEFVAAYARGDYATYRTMSAWSCLLQKTGWFPAQSAPPSAKDFMSSFYIAARKNARAPGDDKKESPAPYRSALTPSTPPATDPSAHATDPSAHAANSSAIDPSAPCGAEAVDLTAVVAPAASTL